MSDRDEVNRKSPEVSQERLNGFDVVTHSSEILDTTYSQETEIHRIRDSRRSSIQSNHPVPPIQDSSRAGVTSRNNDLRRHSTQVNRVNSSFNSTISTTLVNKQAVVTQDGIQCIVQGKTPKQVELKQGQKVIISKDIKNARLVEVRAIVNHEEVLVVCQRDSVTILEESLADEEELKLNLDKT